MSQPDEMELHFLCCLEGHTFAWSGRVKSRLYKVRFRRDAPCSFLAVFLHCAICSVVHTCPAIMTTIAVL